MKEIKKIKGTTIGIESSKKLIKYYYKNKNGLFYSINVYKNGKFTAYVIIKQRKILSSYGNKFGKNDFRKTFSLFPKNIIEIFSRLVEGMEILEKF